VYVLVQLVLVPTHEFEALFPHRVARQTTLLMARGSRS
jgi:hypothetical protein